MAGNETSGAQTNPSRRLLVVLGNHPPLLPRWKMARTHAHTYTQREAFLMAIDANVTGVIVGATPPETNSGLSSSASVSELFL